MASRAWALEHRFFRRAARTRVQDDLANLLGRLRDRLYPESMEVAAYYWLKTTYRAGYHRAEWMELHSALGDALENNSLTPAVRDILSEVGKCIQDDGLLSGGAPPAPALPTPTRPPLDEQVLGPYFVRLMNEWLPAELARRLLEQTETGGGGPGIPAMAWAKAFESLLVRDRIPPSNLERLLTAGVFSPEFVYAADYELLRDVVLFILGRTEAPPYPVLPAALLSPQSGSALFEHYTTALSTARLVSDAGGDEVQLPIPAADALEILQQHEVHLGSIIVTMDGRWWRAGMLSSGDQTALIYRPAGRLLIDYSRDHARMRVPWPELRAQWAGDLALPSIQLFGRRWRVQAWDQSADGTWLDLEFSETLPLPFPASVEEPLSRRCRPAFVDMGWTALQAALTACVAANTPDPVEQLRREELIPLGRALFALAQIATGRDRTPESLSIPLRNAKFQLSTLDPSYGRVPWSVLPRRVRKALDRTTILRSLAGPLNEVFEGPP